MARTVQQIYNQIKAQKNAESSLAGLNSPSNVAIYNLWMWLTAVSIALLEQVLDIYKAVIEGSIPKVGIGTIPWLREKVLEFQYGDNVIYDPSTGGIVYSVVDKSRRIISECSVSQTGNRTVLVKVSKNFPPEPLNSDEYAQLKFYIQQLQFSGTQIRLVNSNSDLLQVFGDIWYNPRYSATIQNDIIQALTNYCKTFANDLNPSGMISVLDIQNVITGVTGVTDIRLFKVGYRLTVGGDIAVIFDLSRGYNLGSYPSYSGTLTPETESGSTFADTLYFHTDPNDPPHYP